MQAVRDKALADRAPSISDVRAVAICGHCGLAAQGFTVSILWSGDIRIQCQTCGQIWQAPAGGCGEDVGGDQALAEGRDEPGQLVSPPEGEEGWNPAVTMPMGRTVMVKTVTGLIRQARRNWVDTDSNGHVHCWRHDRSGDLMAVGWREIEASDSLYCQP